VILVRAGVFWVAIEDFANAVDASCVVEAVPEFLLDVLCGINAEAVDCSM
jgi:hypothetical protein